MSSPKFIWFGLELSLTNTIDVKLYFYQLSMVEGGLHCPRARILVELTTFRKLDGFLPHMKECKLKTRDSNTQRWGTSNSRPTTLTTRPWTPPHPGYFYCFLRDLLIKQKFIIVLIPLDYILRYYVFLLLKRENVVMPFILNCLISFQIFISVLFANFDWYVLFKLPTIH